MTVAKEDRFIWAVLFASIFTFNAMYILVTRTVRYLPDPSGRYLSELEDVNYANAVNATHSFTGQFDYYGISVGLVAEFPGVQSYDSYPFADCYDYYGVPIEYVVAGFGSYSLQDQYDISFECVGEFTGGRRSFDEENWFNHYQNPKRSSRKRKKNSRAIPKTPITIQKPKAKYICKAPPIFYKTPEKERKHVRLSEKEARDLYIRQRILHWAGKGLNKPQIKDKLEEEDDIETSLRTIQRNWKKQPTEILRFASTGRPTVVTPTTKSKILESCGKQYAPSNRELEREFKSDGKQIDHSTISRTFKKEGFGAVLIPTCSKFNQGHAEKRVVYALLHMHKPMEWFNNIIWTEEKYVENSGITNRQNCRVRVRKVADIAPKHYIQRKKFAGKRMVWGGVSAYGLSDTVWLPDNTNVDGHSYYWRVLRAEVVYWKKRTKTDGPCYQRKLWSDEYDEKWIFEQDHASAHATKKVDRFLINNVPLYFKVLRSYANHPWYMPPKNDDWCPVEKAWRYGSNQMDKYYGNESDNLDLHCDRWDAIWQRMPHAFIVRICHSVPAKLYTIVRIKGCKLPPKWKPRSTNPYLCKCNICACRVHKVNHNLCQCTDDVHDDIGIDNEVYAYGD